MSLNGSNVAFSRVGIVFDLEPLFVVFSDDASEVVLGAFPTVQISLDENVVDIAESSLVGGDFGDFGGVS